MGTDALLQLGGSLLAILALAAVAWKLKLGGDTRIRDEAHARELADEAIPGFEAEAIAIDRAGYAALLRDHAGRVLLLRRHGAHFAGRLLTGHAQSRLDRTFLTIATDEKRFGGVTLDLGDQAQYWAASLRRL
jgi:hypothetical protein